MKTRVRLVRVTGQRWGEGKRMVTERKATSPLVKENSTRDHIKKME